jgi:polar amino acid transport system substrate-binding protein
MTITKRAITFICLFLVLSSNYVIANDNEVLSFATDPWPPYFVENESGLVESGVGYELINELFSLIPGVDASFPIVPWKRALLEVERGLKDSIALLLKNDARARYMVFTQPVIQSPSWMYYNLQRFPNGFEWESVKDFKNLRIGIVRGYSYGEPLDSFIIKAPENIFEVTTSKQLFSMLQRQHIDVVPENASVANDIVASQGWTKTLGHAQKMVNTDILHIGISKKSKFVSLIPKLNEAIETLRLSGRIDQIIGVNGNSVNPNETP